jgi:predicted DNA-binding transcriptional regulator AlpA
MKPKKPLTSLYEPGRQRVCNMLAIFSISRPHFYRLVASRVLPKPDGHIGRSPYWLNESIRPYLSPTPTASSKHVSEPLVDNS